MPAVPSSPAATLPWSDALRTGLEPVDEQHQKLLALFNLLAQAQAQGNEGEALQPLIEELLDYTRTHFRMEAELMQRWPVRASHRETHLAAHRDFCDFLSRAQAVAGTHHRTVATELLGFLAQWLLHHIMVVDAHMAREILALQAGTTPATDSDVPDVEHRLIDSLSQVNSRLGQQTFDLLDLNAQLQTEVDQRRDMERNLRRLKDFNSLLALVNQAIGSDMAQDALLQTLCDLAARHAHLALAYIARPNAQGRFEFIASTGRTEALDGLLLSTDPTLPEGQGSVGRAWREGRALFINAYETQDFLAPWHLRARAFGLSSSAALPLYRGGAIWAVLAVYHEQTNVFDSELRSVMEELARDVSRGLDRLDLIARERKGSQVRESLLGNALVGIVMTRGRHIVDANDHFARMIGYPDKQSLVGQLTSSLYPDDEAFGRVRALYPTLRTQGSGQLGSVRLQRTSGEVIRCDLSGSMVQEAEGQLAVWTVVDVTARDQLQMRIEFESLHDVLTGLPNRRALDHDLPKALARAHRSGNIVAVGMLDLDDFKPVNDNHGHEAGDRLLRELARRLLAGLRESDQLVRLGGDEFIVVIEDLVEPRVEAQLSRLLKRLHEAVETPFTIDTDTQAVLGMSMGVALFPSDAQDADALIRMADAAMYQAKLHKHDRTRWWWLHASNTPQPEVEIDTDAFGPMAIELMTKAEPHLRELPDQFVERFYAGLHEEEATAAILRTLLPQELERLKQRQLQHLRFLLDPHTSREAIAARARQIGQVHALVGVSGAWLSKAQSLYRQLLSSGLNHALLPARDRYRTLRAAEARIEEDFQNQLDMEAQVVAAYLDVLASHLPARGSLWSDVGAEGIEALGQLPGLAAALLMRLGPDGVFAVENSAGPRAEQVASLLQTPGSEAVLDPDSPRGQGLTARAWRSLRIESSASYAQDTRYQTWHERARALQVRSSLSVPVLDADGHVVVVISLFGSYPHQFESAVMQQFARGLQHRWEQLWTLSTTPAPVVAQEQALSFRQTLLNGGLRMYMQPIVELRSNRLVKVEALARLEMPHGDIVPPGVFLPLLGSAELDRLFRLGLDQALTHLTQWEQQGLQVDISVNLPPSTLHDPDCSQWVADILLRHKVAPQRLTLELLETHNIETPGQDLSIKQLQTLGVGLAMDDLGSGYSSLQRLSTMPFDTIKIDQSLLLHVRDNPLQTLSLVSTLVQMGRDFERQVVAEGLEDEGVIEAVTVLGANLGQGYGLARPMPAEALVDWHRQLEPTTRGTQVHTFLGALAFHWQFMRQDRGKAASPWTTCPLTRFLHDQGLDDSEAAEWHRQLHSGQGVRQASQKLMHWLVERVQTQGARG